jgi:hypothetical protein
MADYSKLSDAELMALVQPPAAADYSKMSDADLLKMVAPQTSPAATQAAQPIQPEDATAADASTVAAQRLSRGVRNVSRASMVGTEAERMGKFADDSVRAIANGMTFGLADKIAGGMNAVTGQAPSYDEGVKAERARTAALPEGQKVAGELVGGALTGSGLIKNGITVAGRVGTRLLPRVLGFGAEGAGYGAAHEAGNTYSGNPMDYIDAAKRGATTGALIGGGLPLAGSTASGVYKLGSSFLGPRVADTSRGASALLRNAAMADEAGLRNLSQLGPDAMLVDAGPAMLGLGQGAGTGVGAGRSELVNALTTRDAGTGRRLAETLDTTLGPAPVPSRVEAGLAESRQSLGPQYEAALGNAGPVDTRQLAAQLDALAINERGGAQRAARQVRDMLTDAVHTRELSRDPATLLNSRQAIDGLMATETDPNTIRVLEQARRAVDDELTRAVPGIKDVDAQFAELSRQSEGLTRGGQIFDKGKTAPRPTELADEIFQGAQPQGNQVGPSAAPMRMRQGARAELDRVVGTNVNDLGALERTLATPQDWNSQKISAVFGEDARGKVAEALMANRTFRDSYQKIVQNSQTAQRSAASSAMEGGQGGNVPHDLTLTGLGFKAVNLVAKALSGASSANTKDEIGRVLASQGPAVQRLAKELLESAQRAAANSKTLSAVIGSPRLIGALTPAAGRRSTQ